MNQEIIPAYSAYQKVIDLTLYHAFAELIVQMAQDDRSEERRVGKECRL